MAAQQARQVETLTLRQSLRQRLFSLESRAEAEWHGPSLHDRSTPHPCQPRLHSGACKTRQIPNATSMPPLSERASSSLTACRRETPLKCNPQSRARRNLQRPPRALRSGSGLPSRTSPPQPFRHRAYVCRAKLHRCTRPPMRALPVRQPPFVHSYRLVYSRSSPLQTRQPTPACPAPPPSAPTPPMRGLAHGGHLVGPW